ncbi:MAG: dTMP kinase, partial [Nevskiales bacterium]
MPAKNGFITLEGVEGAGKSSQLAWIKDWLEQRKHSVVATREPGGTSLAESIRSVLVDGDEMPAMTELLLMFAARSSHVEEKIRPAL